LRKAAGLKRFRFHDLRHQAITELAEAGASDDTLMAIAGHLSRRMLEHYSHVRMAAKREALARLESGLMGVSPVITAEPSGGGPGSGKLKAFGKGYITIHVTKGQLSGWHSSYPIENSGGRDRTRTCDLLRVKQNGGYS
jgi:hypothetical protein